MVDMYVLADLYRADNLNLKKVAENLIKKNKETLKKQDLCALPQHLRWYCQDFVLTDGILFYTKNSHTMFNKDTLYKLPRMFNQKNVKDEVVGGRSHLSVW